MKKITLGFLLFLTSTGIAFAQYYRSGSGSIYGGGFGRGSKFK